MFKQLHETTTDQKQMATIGREMMDFSENASMAGLKDKQIAVFNMLSDLGAKLTQVGGLFGPREENFSESEFEIVRAWTEDGWKPQEGHACTRTTF
jgi:hypothetical protein|tara:strand:+ start:515 stop:802 length:288 start_codon:yes stop_codon:yes gene_type:complete